MMDRRLPETCSVVIPIKPEFSASVGFIHKESYDAPSYDYNVQLMFISTQSK
jgi:hypothetical protein